MVTDSYLYDFQSRIATKVATVTSEITTITDKDKDHVLLPIFSTRIANV